MSEAFSESRWSGGEELGSASGWAALAPAHGQRFAAERVRSLHAWRHAQALVDRRYGQRGLQLKSAEAPEAELTTVRVCEEDQIVGTLAVRLDGPRGLSADSVFPEEMQALRDGGLRLCEFTRLAVDADAESKQVLARLYHLAYLYAYRVAGAQLLAFEVHPRHAPFYRRMLGAKLLTGERLNPHVNAPAVLMCLPLSHCESQLALYGGRPELSNQTRSLYPLCYSPSDEPMLLRMMVD